MEYRYRSADNAHGWQKDRNKHQRYRRYPAILLDVGVKALPNRSMRRQSGFTLLETLTALSMMGILVTISAMTWLTFLNTFRLNVAQDQAYQVIRLAQSKAKHERRRWQASFRAVPQQVQWAIHPVIATSRHDTVELNWSPLQGGVTIDSHETTLYRSPDDIYRVQFNHYGHVNGRLGRLTLAGLNPHNARRCIFVSTLIGTLRKAGDRPRPRNGRYCY